jgi:hypothetical protein
MKHLIVAHSSSPAQDAALFGAETGGSNPRWAILEGLCSARGASRGAQRELILWGL